MKTKSERFDIVVIGGGLAGFCAAVAAARLGSKVCLIQNRPVFGGNSSSEIRVTPHGAAAFHAYARETGIISELLIQERAVNHEEIFENGWTNSVWDMVMYDMATNTQNLTIQLNTSIDRVEMEGKRKVKAVIGSVQNAELEIIVEGDVFIDCTGDGTVADLAGCEWRMGSEGRSEFNEPHAPEVASMDTMGSSIHFKTKNVGRPVPFTAPSWAKKYEDASFFYEQGRLPKEEKGGYWWIEIGVPYDTIHQNEDIRHELTRHALGVWDWMKNQDPKMKEICKNYALDWIGQVPGKRESRRIMGQYLMTEHDPQNRTVFEDEIAFGGWFIDLHTPGGLLAKHSEFASGENYNAFTDYAVKSYAGPYGIPLRCLISKDVDNLMMAGRNVSTTHAALGTVRVMGTTALMGQAAGTAAALSVRERLSVHLSPKVLIKKIQQQLLRDGCYLINCKNEDPEDLALKAEITSSSQYLLKEVSHDLPTNNPELKVWRDQPQYDIEKLETRRGQLIAVNTEELNSVSVFLTNHSSVTKGVKAWLLETEGIWDYGISMLPILAHTVLSVPPGTSWVEWPVNSRGLKKGRFVRLDLDADPALSWHVSPRIESGHMSVFKMSKDRMRRFGNGHTLCFRVDPGQPSFPPENVLSGFTRPNHFTNLWKSDPADRLPQWLQLNWSDRVRLSRVELTFPGHLIREYHAYAPFYRDVQCPKAFSIACWEGQDWIEVFSVTDNFQRQVKCDLTTPVETDKIRITITETNGDPSAQIYEVRCY